MKRLKQIEELKCPHTDAFPILNGYYCPECDRMFHAGTDVFRALQKRERELKDA